MSIAPAKREVGDMGLQPAAVRPPVVAGQDGWASLFASAFRTSRNPMVLLDADRRHVDSNGAYLKLLGYNRDRILGTAVWEFVAGGPLVSSQEWARLMATRNFTGEVGLVARDGTVIAVQWGATAEVVTGSQRVLLVVLSTSRWGKRFRRDILPDQPPGSLSPRELEIVRLVAMGDSGPEIADELHISHDTVRTHVRNAMAKLGARSRAHLVARALGDGHVLT
jgi:PAS domain S-box-containing protein